MVVNLMSTLCPNIVPEGIVWVWVMEGDQLWVKGLELADDIVSRYLVVEAIQIFDDLLLKSGDGD